MFDFCSFTFLPLLPINPNKILIELLEVWKQSLYKGNERFWLRFMVDTWDFPVSRSHIILIVFIHTQPWQLIYTLYIHNIYTYGLKLCKLHIFMKRKDDSFELHVLTYYLTQPLTETCSGFYLITHNCRIHTVTLCYNVDSFPLKPSVLACDVERIIGLRWGH